MRLRLGTGGRASTAGAMAAAVLALASPGAAAQEPAGCDPIDPARCLLPWPNDHFTRADRGTPTGRRVALTADLMPRNVQGTPIAPGDYNHADGFSPGSLIITKVPGLDTPAAFARTGAVPVTDMARSFDPEQPVVLVNARTGRRQLIWAELDSVATSPADTALLIRPGRNLREGERYIVALRRLRDAAGNLLEPSPAFRNYRDRIRTSSPAFERRRPHMERIFRALRRAGIARDELYRAWDFTVASRRTLAGRLLTMRDETFAELGDRRLADGRVQGRSPAFTVSTVTDFPACGADGCQPGEDDVIRRRVEGTVDVPCWLDQPNCPPGSRFALDARGRPVRTAGNVHQANFICNVPRTVSAFRPGRPALYGHGLFGSAREVNSIARRELATRDGVILCATDWIGMSGGDIPNAIGILQDLSRFPTLADRLQQSMLNFLLLGRTMIHPGGFRSHPAFQEANGFPLLGTEGLSYAGGSQGGILGGALTAVAPDFTRSALIVGAINYSTLLTRSIDFDVFASVLYPSYPDELQRPLALALVQMLWDRGEGNGYAQHMTDDPYRDTPRHEVLYHMAYGDHQVANVATEVAARTIGARLRTPALDPGRSPDVVPFYGIPPVRRYPHRGSALVVWDIGPLRPPGCGTAGQPGCEGTGVPPTTNTPPRLGRDPHGLTARETAAQVQIGEFLRPGGTFIDTCGARPCYAAGWTGPPG